jgi:fructosamine-3-kinase
MIDISGPFLAVESDELEIKFKYVMDEHWCGKDHRLARFIVEQRVGDSVKTFSSHELDKTKRLLISMRVFEKGVKLLESVHQLGIVHGDIHAGNIALCDFKVSTMVQLEEYSRGLACFNSLGKSSVYT